MDKPHPLQVATGRFGFGLQGDASGPGGLDPRGDLRGQLDAQLDRPVASMGNDLDDSAAQLRAGEQRRLAGIERKRERARAETASTSGGKPMAPAMAGNMADTEDMSRRAAPVSSRRDELDALLTLAMTGDALPERLSLHWFNHFTVSAVRARVGLAGGAYLREALRANMLGRFRDMLVAAVTHPVMMFYLDNQASTGPNSQGGRRRNAGLNENLAREVLELHTLGVNGGYTQADVTSLAKVMTGWQTDLDVDSPTAGKAIFDARRHEPGTKTVLGKTYPDVGPEQLALVLTDLAAHPATATHVATRMARHFVSERPSPQLVDAMARSFRSTGGDLKAMTRTLVRSDEAWTAPPLKLRPPIEFIAATARLIGSIPKPPPPVIALSAMGQPFMMAPSPQGWNEDDDGWATSDGIKTRLDWSQEVADRYAPRIDVAGLVNDRLRPVVSDETRTAVLRAESREQALVLLLMSPDFQRR